MRRLKEWGIVPSGTCEMRIEGYCETSGELLTTANVTRRICSNRIVCVDGNSYELVGGLDVKSGIRGRIPSRILEQFMLGVPRSWRQVVRGWTRPAEDTGAGINRKTGNSARRGLCIVQPHSPNENRPSAALSPQRIRHRTRSVLGEAVAGVVSNSLEWKTQQAIESGEGKAGRANLSQSEKPCAVVKNVAIVVEKLSPSRIPEGLRATRAMKPNCSAASGVSWSGVKTRKQSDDSNLPTCTRATRSRRAAYLQGNDRITTARKKIATVTNTRMRSASCPAHASAGIGAKTDPCLDMRVTRARSASAGKNSLSTKQCAQGTCEAYGKLKTPTSSKLAKEKMQCVPAVHKSISQQGLAFAASTAPPPQVKLIEQVTQLKKNDEQREEPKHREAQKVSNSICNDRDPEKAPKKCQTSTGQSVQTRGRSRGNKMEPGSNKKPVSGKQKLGERSLSGRQDVAASQKNVFSTRERAPVTKKRASSSSPGTLPRKRSARIMARAKTPSDVIKNQSGVTSRERAHSEMPQVKVQANGSSAIGNYCRQSHKGKVGASVGLGRRSRKGKSREGPDRSPPDEAKASDSNIIEKAEPRPVLSVRVTRKSMQQSTEQKFKNDDKEREKPRSQGDERSSDEKSMCDGYVTESAPEEGEKRASHCVVSVSECFFSGIGKESGEGLAAKSVCTVPTRRKLKLDGPHETVPGRQQADIQCRKYTLRSYPVIKQKPTEAQRKNSSTVINSQHTTSKTEDMQRVSYQQNLDERSLSQHRNVGGDLESIFCENQTVPTVTKCAATLSSGMRPKRRTARNFAEVKTAGTADKEKCSAKSRKQKQPKQPEEQVCSNATNTNCYELKCPAKACGLTGLTESKNGKSQKPSKLGAAHTSKMGSHKIVKKRAESSPSKKHAQTSKAQNQGSKPKLSWTSPQLTKALLAVTARKGTLKRKAQIRNLTDALAAKDACDDFYHASRQPGIIPSTFFDQERWDELSGCRLSGMTTPTPNSPLINPRSPMSTSSICSTSTLPSPSVMDAIVQGIQKREKPVILSTPPKPKRKQQNLDTVIKDLQKLEKKLEQYHLKENCADSDEDVEVSVSDQD